ncbi:MAG: SH3 domain-containing protein [Planctomycetota bacterium]
MKSVGQMILKMSPRIAVMTALILAVPGVAMAGPGAEKSGAKYAGEITANQLRLRAGPGQAYQEVVRLARGDKVVVVGRHPNATEWLRVEVPQGFHAWVFGKYVEKSGKSGVVQTDRLLIRPRPSTRYHQLQGRFNRGDKLKIESEKAMTDGVWYRVWVSRKVPLYAHGDFIKNVGPASLAEAVKKNAVTPAKLAVRAKNDKTLILLDKNIATALKRPAGTAIDIAPMQRTFKAIDLKALAPTDRTLYYRVHANLTQLEKREAIRGLQAKESRLKGDLERRLKLIEEDYQRKLAAIEAEANKPKKPQFTAIGILKHAPDLFGKRPSHRLVEGNKIRYYLISTSYDLSRFSGKRVGVIGLLDPESGTGRYTIMVRRIEILGEE